MSQAEDLLNSLTADSESEEHIVIGRNKVVTVPESLMKIAVQFEHNVKTVTFDCPRHWDGRDLSTMKIYINYLRSDGKIGQYAVDNLTIDETDDTMIHFDWTITKNATLVKGPLSFLVCAKKNNSEGNEENHWNSELNRDMTVSEGLECDESILEQYPDIITQILTRLDAIGTGDGGEIIVSGLPTVTAEDNGKVMTVVNGAWAAAELPSYDGDYVVTPSETEQTLQTSQKLMSSDLKINKIPYAEVSNNSGGLTVTIGSEV